MSDPNTTNLESNAPNPSTAASRVWREKNKEKYEAYQREYSRANSQKKAAAVKEWRKTHPRPKQQPNDATASARLKYRFGITLNDYNEMFTKQGGACAICFEPPKAKRLHVDHDHTTKKVRGLLCGKCNQALGLFRERESVMLAAIDYLKQRR